MRNRIILSLPPDLLFRILGIPNATLLDAKVDQFGDGTLLIVFGSPDMPECADYEYAQTASLEEIKCRIQ